MREQLPLPFDPISLAPRTLVHPINRSCNPLPDRSQTQPYPIRFHIIRNGNFKKRDTKKEHPGRSMEAIEPGESSRESICDPFLSSFLPLSPPNPSTPEKSFTIFRWSGSHGVVFRYTESGWRADGSHARLERLLDPSRLFPFASSGQEEMPRLRSATDSCNKVGSSGVPNMTPPMVKVGSSCGVSILSLSSLPYSRWLHHTCVRPVLLCRVSHARDLELDKGAGM
ncbi:hypothetical protein BHM03_00041839 [Ensete ventricosum]|nr:hypothetical protein BHM03_00041839 [Ensete ventricosum]